MIDLIYELRWFLFGLSVAGFCFLIVLDTTRETAQKAVGIKTNKAPSAGPGGKAMFRQVELTLFRDVLSLAAFVLATFGLLLLLAN